MRVLLAVLALVVTVGTASAETVRRVEYGMFVRGMAVGGDQEDESYRREIFRFHGSAGDNVHVAVIAPTASAVLIELSRANAATTLEHDRSIVDRAGKGEKWTTGPGQITERFAGDFTLPDDGDYDVTISIMRSGLNSDSPPIRYAFAIDRDRVVKRLEFLVAGRLGWHMQILFGTNGGMVEYSTESFGYLGFTLALGPGYQFSEKLGIDALVTPSIAIVFSDTRMNKPPAVVLSTLIGPRLRYGNKVAGHTGVSAGITHMLSFTHPEGAKEPDAIGFGARIERVIAVADDPGVMFTLTVHGQWNGAVSVYGGGIGLNF